MCLGIVSGGLGHLDPWILSWSQLLESPGYAGALSVSVRGCSFHRTERKLLRWLGGHDERLGCAPRGHPPVGLEPARRGRKGGTNMMDSHFENRSGSPGGHYSRWPDPWRREDDWGPITAAVMFFIILAGLIIYGSGAHL
jgi:hypothetical protein